MKWILGITLLLSLTDNGYFVIEEIRDHRIQEIDKILNNPMDGDLYKKPWKKGFGIFARKLEQIDQTLLGKKYYFINVWTSTCKPCIKEMPWLDSIAGRLDKDVGYFFVTDMNEALAVKCINRINYKFKNFVFLNDMNDFVSEISNQQARKGKVYPMTLVLSKDGDLLYISSGAFGNAREASGFAKLVNKLE